MQNAGNLDVTRWDSLEGRYSALQAVELDQAAVPAWLEEWSALAEEIGEAASWLSIRRTQDTTDPERRDAYLAFVKTVAPKITAAEDVLKRKLLATGWARPDMETVLRYFRSDADMFREENLALIAEHRAEMTRYNEIVGSLTVEFDGAERTLAQLAPYRASKDRAVREAAWRAGSEAMLSVRTTLDDLFDTLFDLRHRIATKAGHANYLEYRWQELGRFDYTIADAESFHTAVLDTVTPALERLSARKSALLGLPGLRPWDTDVDPYGDEPLQPFDSGSALAEATVSMFAALDPELGRFVEVMRDEDLLDLENRSGKAPGGYCASLPKRRRPFIFMNSVGTLDNLRTMLHEAGHAFHTFYRADQPYLWQRSSPIEFAEVASMSMELLTYPQLERGAGGVLDSRDATRAKVEHLHRLIRFLPYMATVSAFQHWLYTSDRTDRVARDAAWRDLYLKFNPDVDWTGLEPTLESLWHHKLHFFTVPLYYIEYGIAQLGALQVWRNSLADPHGALSDYKAGLTLGGTRTLPELFRAAGAELAFRGHAVGPLVQMVEDHAARLEAELV